MKKLYLTLVYLFCFQSGAVGTSLCKPAFENPSDRLTAYYNSRHGYLLKKATFTERDPLKLSYHTESISLQALVDFIPYAISINHLNRKGQLLKEWKDQVLKNLGQFEKAQLLTLFHNLALLSDKLYLENERDFFKSLEKISIRYIPEFSKKQMMDIIWIFVQLEMKSSEEKFIRVWRESALKMRREFTSLDRYALTDLFRKLEIQTADSQY